MKIKDKKINAGTNDAAIVCWHVMETELEDVYSCKPISFDYKWGWFAKSKKESIEAARDVRQI